MRTILFLLLLTTAVSAQDAPSYGSVHNTQEMSSLRYECRAVGLETVECEFVQVSVRRKAKQEELAAKVSAARKEFQEKKAKGFNPRDCDAFRAHAAAQKQPATLPVEQREALFRMTPKERQFGADLTAVMMTICDAPSEEAFVKLAQVLHAKDAKTCTVSSNPFKQSFKRVARSSVWTANDGPNGPCGVINVSRLERSKDGQQYLYNYVSRKIVSNPNAETLSGAKCTGMDQAEYLYDWKSKTWNSDCDFVEFSH